MAEGSRGDKPGAMRIDPRLVRELAELLSENQLTEIEVEDGDRKIKVCREPAPVIAGAAPRQPPSRPRSPRRRCTATRTSASARMPAAMRSSRRWSAPLSSRPSRAPPFVAVGEAVKAGDTLLIIEAMKVMNPITAPEGGIVKQILVADAQPVEFDQPLLVIG